MDRRQTLENNLDRQLRWIGAADAKIPPILAIGTAMLGVLTGFAPKPGDWTWLLGVATAAALMMIVSSIVSLFLAAFPRTQGPKGSLVYFGGITEYEENAFMDQILDLDEEGYAKDLASQCYRNAEIAGEKFSHVKTANKLLFSGFVPWVVALYLMVRIV